MAHRDGTSVALSACVVGELRSSCAFQAFLAGGCRVGVVDLAPVDHVSLGAVVRPVFVVARHAKFTFSIGFVLSTVVNLEIKDLP